MKVKQRRLGYAWNGGILDLMVKDAEIVQWYFQWLPMQGMINQRGTGAV
ncbi:MAG: hypothetical protein WDW20_03935 [Neisseriaceae bacterium]